MEGISKESLLEMRNTCEARDRYSIDLIIKECTELNPWMPINEHTPKYRFLLLYSPDIEGVSKKFVGKLESCWYWKPTHWQELPDDPK